ncbi:MAG: hypothetical protein WC648_01860 [Candidatus Paceibacterota bacterium]|jgi:hypothetical protein
MIEFRNHDGFEKEVSVFERRFKNVRFSLSGFKKLCEIHFNPLKPSPRIAPGKLHRITQNDVWSLWKTELPIIKSGLRPNQYPRIWFVVQGNTIVFLCMATHIDKYDDEEMNRIAQSRVTDLF